MSPMFGIPQKEGASKTPVVNFKLIVVVTLLRKVIDNVKYLNQEEWVGNLVPYT